MISRMYRVSAVLPRRRMRWIIGVGWMCFNDVLATYFAEVNELITTLKREQ